MRTSTVKRTILMILAAAGLLPAWGEAQERTWTYWAQSSGWLGISVQYEGLLSVEGEEEGIVVVITEVAEGSPAQEQGLRVGDTITLIDGRSVSQQVLFELRETLQPEDQVQIVVARGGTEREVTVKASTRAQPVVVSSANVDQLVVTLDTIRGAILDDLESLTLSIAGLHLNQEQGEMSVKLLRSPSGDVGVAPRGTIFKFPGAEFDTLSLGPEAFVLDPGFAMPFEAFFVRSAESDSLRSNMALLSRQLREVKRQELSRQRQIIASIQGPPEEHLHTDERIQALRAQESELVREQEELSRRLNRVLEEESRRQWAEASARSREAFSQTQWARAESRVRATEEEAQRQRNRARELETLYNYEIRYRTPQIVGENFVLGAELQALNPAVAKVFSVEEGVMVWNVPEGTPAEEFGFRVGDVIIRMAGEAVRSIGDVRLNLESLGRPLSVHVVRSGEAEPVEVIIRK